MYDDDGVRRSAAAAGRSRAGYEKRSFKAAATVSVALALCVLSGCGGDDSHFVAPTPSPTATAAGVPTATSAAPTATASAPSSPTSAPTQTATVAATHTATTVPTSAATVAPPTPTSTPINTPTVTPTETPMVANPTIEGPITGPGFFFIQSTRFEVTDVGYEEAEYFVAGTASAYVNVGDLGSDGRWTAAPDSTAPYKTRIVVYRPM